MFLFLIDLNCPVQIRIVVLGIGDQNATGRMMEHSFTSCGREDLPCEMPKPTLDGSVDTPCHVILDSITQTLGK